MAASEDEIASNWPLHWMVWKKDHTALNRLLEQHRYDKESKDPRGRTPLHLAVALGDKNCVEVLLKHGASTLTVNRHQWNVFHEAICTGEPEIVNLVAIAKDREQSNQTAKTIPLLLERLQSAPDFYTEMKWEFTSWIPFLSRVCPSDTYKIWKKGTQVRVDTTLIGFDNMQWLRGSQSFVFNVTGDGARFIEIDHDKKLMWEHPMELVSNTGPTTPEEYMARHGMSIMQRLSSPVASTVFDMNSIEFQRQKAGIWGFRSDRKESVNGYNAKVFAASGLELVTRTRVDHLPKEERSKYKEGSSNNPLQELLGMSEGVPMEPPPTGGNNKSTSAAANLLLGCNTVSDNSKIPQLSALEYFSPPKNPKEYDSIGHSVEVYQRAQNLKATVWLAEDHPLSLQDQVMPVIDLMAVNNAHFAKLKDFITLQMPAGFPIKFEIPLFHVMSARVTFGNINGLTQPAPYISLQDETIIDSQPLSQEHESVTRPDVLSTAPALKRRHTNPSPYDEPTPTHSTTTAVTQHEVQPRHCTKCLISDEAFTVPEGYRNPRQQQHRIGTLADEEEELLQMAIRQSLLEHTPPTDSSNTQQDEPLMLSEALQDSSIMSQVTNHPFLPAQLAPYAVVPSPSSYNVEDEDFLLALELSKAQAREDEERRERQKQEDEELEQVLKLSLIDK